LVWSLAPWVDDLTSFYMLSAEVLVATTSPKYPI
jgi:hypothetical protein